MALIYLDEAGHPTTFNEALGEVNAGTKSLVIMRCQSTFASDVLLDIQVIKAPDYIRLVNYSRQLKPQEVGALEFEIDAPDDIDRVPEIAIQVRPKLIRSGGGA